MTDFAALPHGFLPALPLAAAGAVSLLRGGAREQRIAAGNETAGYGALGRYRLLCCAAAATSAALAMRPAEIAPPPFALLFAVTLIAALGCAALHGFRPEGAGPEETAEAERACGFAFLAAASALICFFAPDAASCVCFAAGSALIAAVACGRARAILPAGVAAALLTAGAAFGVHDGTEPSLGPFLPLKEYPGAAAAAPLFTLAGAALMAVAPARPGRGEPASDAARAALAVTPVYAASYLLLRLFQGAEWLIPAGFAVAGIAAVRACMADRVPSALRALLICQTGAAAAAVGSGDPLSLTSAAGCVCSGLPAMMLMQAGAETAARASGESRASRSGGAFTSVPFAGACALIGALCLCGFPFTTGYAFRPLPQYSAEAFVSLWTRLGQTAVPCLLTAGCGWIWFVFFRTPETPLSSAAGRHDPKGLGRAGLAGLALMCLAPGWPGLADQTLYVLLPQTPDVSSYSAGPLLAQTQLLYFAGAGFLALAKLQKKEQRRYVRTQRPRLESEHLLDFEHAIKQTLRRSLARRAALNLHSGRTTPRAPVEFASSPKTVSPESATESRFFLPEAALWLRQWSLSDALFWTLAIYAAYAGFKLF